MLETVKICSHEGQKYVKGQENTIAIENITIVLDQVIYIILYAIIFISIFFCILPL